MQRLQVGGRRWLTRLRSQLDHAREQMQQFRDRRAEIIKELGGQQHAEGAAPHAVPYPMLHMAVEAYAMFAAARNPQVLVSTWSPAARSGAALLEPGLNQLLPKISFETTLRRLVRECAISGIGMAKVGMFSEQSPRMLDGETYDIGCPGIDAIDFDSCILDISAARIDRIQFAGDEYELPLWWVKEAKRYRKKTVRDIEKCYDDMRMKKPSHSITRAPEYSITMNQFEPTITVVDVYCPMDNVVVTIPVKGDGYLERREWEGATGGPYRYLTFNEAPGQVFPVPTVGLLKPLHDMINVLGRKLSQQAEQAKRVFLSRSGNVDDVKLVMNAQNGEWLAVTNPQVEPLTIPGPDGSLMGFKMETRNAFNYVAGNLDQILGASSQADTAAQEQILAAGASRRMEWFEHQVQQCAKKLICDLAWYVANDSAAELEVTRKYANGLGWKRIIGRDDIADGIEDYEIDIAPFSMRSTSPSQVLNGMMQVVNMAAGPLAGQLAQQGISLDTKGMIETMARMMGISRFMGEFLQFNALPPREDEMAAQQPSGGKMANTRREYVRRNVSSGGTNSDSAALKAMQSGAGEQ